MSASSRFPDVVLLTGAGFSVAMGLCSQARLLWEVESIESDLTHPDAIEFEGARSLVNEFLRTVFWGAASTGGQQLAARRHLGLSDQELELVQRVQLEDVYTLLDRAIMEGIELPPFRLPEILEIRGALDKCLSYVITRLETQASAKRDPALRLFEVLSSQYDTSWTVVSTNWDTLWDSVVAEKFAEEVPDYGIDVTSLATGELCRRSGDWRLRVYKLHGSFNWWACPNCHSVSVDPADATARRCFSDRPCSACGAPDPVVHVPRLRRLFVTPSMLKRTGGAALQEVWSTTLRVLGRAKKIIVVGYSLPQADHDLRVLLRIGIKGSRIEVVLSPDDNPETISVERLRSHLPQAQYEGLLGRCGVHFDYQGWETYFSLGALPSGSDNSLAKQSSLSS